MIHPLTIVYFFIILVEVFSKSNGTECSTKGCVKQPNILLLVFAISAGVLSLIGCFVLFILFSGQICKRKSKPTTNENIQNNETTEYELHTPIRMNHIFESGQWSSRYYRDGSFHGPFQYGIIFNVDQNTLKGSGVDDIGYLTVTGTISLELLTINMIKKYYSNNGKSRRNLKREVKIDLEWNDDKCAFEGTWFAQKSGYNDEGSYELIKVQQSFNNSRKHYNYV